LYLNTFFPISQMFMVVSTRGAIGMLHPDEDANGGSAAFFWIRSVDESLKGKDGAEFQGLGSLQRYSPT
jgi:hypothetical protein